jgi:hypothetical protein
LRFPIRDGVGIFPVATQVLNVRGWTVRCAASAFRLINPVTSCVVVFTFNGAESLPIRFVIVFLKTRLTAQGSLILKMVQILNI